MGFTGRPSKGCLPCRQKRTKCDLALPACSQCVRKGRICTGYRSENDLIFKDETKLVVKKTQGKKQSLPALVFEEPPFAAELSNALSVQHPSRRVCLPEEAVLHFFSHFTEKHFTTSGQVIDFCMPVFRADVIRGGPAAEMATACGFASLGVLKGAPDLILEARRRQTKVLRMLSQQLQDPTLALSNSSQMTCIWLSAFENIVSDGTQNMAVQTTHLRAVAKMAQLRGTSQFEDDAGIGIYGKMRGNLLAHCIKAGEAIPDFITEVLEDPSLKHVGFDPTLYKLGVECCRLRAEYKRLGYVTDTMVEEAREVGRKMYAVFPNGRPSVDAARHLFNEDAAYRYIYPAMGYIVNEGTRLQMCDMVLAWARQQYNANPNPETFKILQQDETDYTNIYNGVRDNYLYYMDGFGACVTSKRCIAAHVLFYPLTVLLTASTTSPATLLWIAEQTERIADIFGLRMGILMANGIRMMLKRAAGGAVPVQSPPSATSSSAVTTPQSVKSTTPAMRTVEPGNTPTSDGSPITEITASEDGSYQGADVIAGINISVAGIVDTERPTDCLT